ncbi:MAG: hypothetical protein PHQ53_07200 [Candidatus Krumholzibacteria bacterium]|nr:hypothetical protein [Candidatus Krumholzibacteria bacterium]
MRTATVLALLVLPAVVLAQRPVESNRIISSELPAAIIEVVPGLEYAGSQQFELYEVAEVEQHFFVELDGSRIKRLLLVQFEGFLPSVENTYQYWGDTVTHSGQIWYHGTVATRLPETEPRPESAGARSRAYLAAKGWTLGPDIFSERFVWLLDSPPRNELLVFYTEDLADQGLTAADVKEGGAAFDRWPVLLEGLHRRALAAVRVITAE